MALNASDDHVRATTVLIVDDHALLARSLAGGLRDEGFDAHVVDGLDGAGTATTVLDAVRRVDADIVLLDLMLFGAVGDGLPLIEPLVAGGARVIVLTGATDDALLGACLEAGATGIVSKSSSLDVLLDQLVRAARGVEPLPVATRQELLGTLRRRRAADRARLEPFGRLTPRERAVLGALMDGASPQAIASSSVVSIATVRSQIRSILEKLGVHSQGAAVAMAHRAGWSPP